MRWTSTALARGSLADAAPDLTRQTESRAPLHLLYHSGSHPRRDGCGCVYVSVVWHGARGAGGGPVAAGHGLDDDPLARQLHGDRSAGSAADIRRAGVRPCADAAVVDR